MKKVKIKMWHVVTAIIVIMISAIIYGILNNLIKW